VFDLLRQFPETVDQLGGKRVDGMFVLDLGQPPLEGEAD
jgi:hypothetical protein